MIQNKGDLQKIITIGFLALLTIFFSSNSYGYKWEKTFGDSNGEEGNSVQQTADGGYIITGEKTYTGDADVYLIKADADGDMVWEKTFGLLFSFEIGYSVQQTTDGGYVIAGYGYGGVYLIKTDTDGNMQWEKTFGGSDADRGYSVQQTTDGGYIIVGYTYALGAMDPDVYLIKTDADGNMQWEKTFGGSNFDYGHSAQQTIDGGYIIAGYTNSFGAGQSDFYLIKTDADGKMLWEKTFGGPDDDIGYLAQQTADGGYIIAGDTYSFGAGQSDIYLIYYNTVKPRKVTLLTPNGGEIIPSGSNYTIGWKANPEVESFKLWYSLNNGKDWTTIVKGIAGTTYDWKVPTPTKNKYKCLTKIVGYNASGEKEGVDKSDAPFFIEVMNVTSPNGGEVLASGGTYDVTWDINDTKNPVDYVKLFCSINKGKTWKLFGTTSGDPGTLPCVFPIVKKNENDCLVKVLAYDAADKKVAQDKSDVPFFLEVVTITSPNGGEMLSSGQMFNIEWDTYETKKQIAKVVLKYTINGGKKWKGITTIKGDNPGSYLWTVPTVSKTKNKCKVKIQLKDKKGKSLGRDTSDSHFMIQP